MPAVPTVLPASSAGDSMRLSPIEMSDVSGTYTSAPIDTSFAPLSRASRTSGS